MPKSDYALKQKKAKLYASPVQAVIQPVKTALGQFAEPLPGYPVWGIDTSHWSGPMDLAKLKAEGGTFVIIKYLHGKLRTRWAKENYRYAKDAGLAVSSYQWLVSVSEGVSPGGQAREYAAMLKDYPVDFVPWIDYERSSNGKRFNPDLGDLTGWQVPFEDAYGDFGIYTSNGYWGEKGSPSEKWRRPFWQARYGKSTLFTRPWGNDWDIWQYSEGGNGRKYGALLQNERVAEFGPHGDGEKSIDMNVFRGSLDEFNVFCGVGNG